MLSHIQESKVVSNNSILLTRRIGMRYKSFMALIVFVVVAFAQAVGAEVDREKLLKEPGV